MNEIVKEYKKLKREFHSLYNTWYSQTAHFSFTYQVTKDPNYKPMMELTENSLVMLLLFVDAIKYVTHLGATDPIGYFFGKYITENDISFEYEKTRSFVEYFHYKPYEFKKFMLRLDNKVKENKKVCILIINEHIRPIISISKSF